MKIYHHINAIGIGGTEKTCGIFCKYLAQQNYYEVRIISKVENDQTRVPWLKKIKVPFSLYEDKRKYQQLVYDADIIHFHRGGWPEPPCVKDWHNPKTKLTETNIFGFRDLNAYQCLDGCFYISEAVNPHYDPKQLRSFKLPNPIELPYSNEKANNKPNSPFVIGQLQRPDDKHMVMAPHQAIAAMHDLTFWIINPGQILTDWNPPNHYFTKPIFLDEDISKFYNSIDMLIASRHNGDTFGCTIQEAAMHGVPSLIHIARGQHARNAHIDIFVKNDLLNWIIRDANSIEEWNDKIKWGINEVRTNLDHWSKKFKQMAMQFEASKVTQQLISYYKEILK